MASSWIRRYSVFEELQEITRLEARAVYRGRGTEATDFWIVHQKPRSVRLIPMRKVLAIIVFALFFLSATEAWGQTPPEESRKPQTSLAELPESVLNAELPLLGGKTLRLSEYSGKVIVLNMFATWCVPCRVESPDLAKLHEEFKDRGLVVIELSTEDPNVSKELVREWVLNFRLPYTVGWITRDVAQTLMQGRTSIPQAFVIARDGRILKRFIGYNPDTTLDQLRGTVDQALK